jgi:formimidoylglutamate deiminase
MLEEMRWLEYGQRLAGRARGVLTDGDGEVAPVLLAAATAGGARSLGLPVGELATGRWADFALVDLDHRDLAGTDGDSLPAALVFGAGNATVAGSALAGHWSDAAIARPS